MNTASVADVKAKLSAYMKASARGPVVITKNGKAVAALIAVAGEEQLESLLLAHSPRLRSILDSARERIRAGGGVSHAEFWNRVASPKRRRNGR
jgi:prevent-host-death family protein